MQDKEFRQYMSKLKEVFLEAVRKHPAIRFESEEEKPSLVYRDLPWHEGGVIVGYEIVNPTTGQTFPSEFSNENDRYIGNNESRVAPGNLNLTYHFEKKDNELDSCSFSVITTTRPYFNPNFSKDWNEKYPYCDDIELALTERVLEEARTANPRLDVDGKKSFFVVRPLSQLWAANIFSRDREKFCYGIRYYVAIARELPDENIRCFVEQQEEIVTAGINAVVQSTIDYILWKDRFGQDRIAEYTPVRKAYIEGRKSLDTAHSHDLGVFVDKSFAEFLQGKKGEKA